MDRRRRDHPESGHAILERPVLCHPESVSAEPAAELACRIAVANETLWEAICALAGPEGDQSIPVDQAINRSAVSEGVARVELKQFTENNLIRQLDAERVELTVNGRARCQVRHHTSAVTNEPQTAPEGPAIEIIQPESLDPAGD